MSVQCTLPVSRAENAIARSWDINNCVLKAVPFQSKGAIIFHLGGLADEDIIFDCNKIMRKLERYYTEAISVSMGTQDFVGEMRFALSGDGTKCIT